jgi:hypothetical protein
MSPDERREGGFIPIVGEATEKLAIAEPRSIVQKYRAAQVPDNLVRPARRHVPPLSLVSLAAYLLFGENRCFVPRFS